MSVRIFLILIAISAISGCGYSLGVRLTDEINSLEVPIFDNLTLIRGVEFDITNALTQEIKMRTSARLVTAGGDAVLSGKIMEYEKVPVYEEAGEVIAGRIRLTANFELILDGAEEPIREGAVSETQDFDIRTGIPEEEAINTAMREIARKIVYHIEAW